MRQLAFLILILIVPCKLPAGAPEISAPAPAGGPALSKDASEILARMTDFISAAPVFTLLSDTGYEVLQKDGHLLELSDATFKFSPPDSAQRVNFLVDSPGEDLK